MYNTNPIEKEEWLLRRLNYKQLILSFSFLTTTLLSAQDISALAKELNLYGGTKATIQWERVFSSQRHLVRYHLENLDGTTRKKLKQYLIEHSADSQQPIVPGL